MAESSSPPSSKRIQFAEDKNKTLVYEDDTENFTIADRWFSTDDYITIKAKAREESKAWRREGYGFLLKETFENPQETTQEYLIAFARLGGDLSRRGLERHLAKQHGEERSDLKDRARQTVFQQQKRMRRKGLSSEEMAGKLASVYGEICKAASVFAMRLGQADEVVAMQGEDSSHAARLHDELYRGPGGRKLERRMSGLSHLSGQTSCDSKNFIARSRQGVRKSNHRCPASPASAMEEYYAAIA